MPGGSIATLASEQDKSPVTTTSTTTGERERETSLYLLAISVISFVFTCYHIYALPPLIIPVCSRYCRLLLTARNTTTAGCMGSVHLVLYSRFFYSSSPCFVLSLFLIHFPIFSYRHGVLLYPQSKYINLSVILYYQKHCYSLFSTIPPRFSNIFSFRRGVLLHTESIHRQRHREKRYKKWPPKWPQKRP